MRLTMRSWLWTRKSVVARAIAVIGTAALVGCEGTVTLDMGTTPAADPGIVDVVVEIDGIELNGSDGTETLRFDDPVRVDLLDYVDGNLFRLFTDEELPDGRYTSIRLLFDPDEEEDDFVGWFDNEDFEINVVEDVQAADVTFSVDKNDSSREDVVITLDVRQSLSFNDDTNVYTLNPVVRGVRTDDAGRIVGTVTLNCPSGTALEQGGAVYLFSGEGRTPDDRDGQDEEAYLTTRLTIDSGTAAIPRYTFTHVPEGDYTIAVTCNGDEDDAATNDDVRFQESTNVRVRAEEIATVDFD